MSLRIMWLAVVVISLDLRRSIRLEQRSSRLLKNSLDGKSQS